MLWRPTRLGEGLDQFFVHWLNDTVIRPARRLFRHPGAGPARYGRSAFEHDLGDFFIEVQWDW
jgi:hypothetical protein